MRVETATKVVGFLGLSDVSKTASSGEASFPLGILYPYSGDLQRVCSRYDDLDGEDPDTAAAVLAGLAGTRTSDPLTQTATAFLASIATLHSRIVFAPGPAGPSVAAAYVRASRAIAPR